jgi:hypothetical protein
VVPFFFFVAGFSLSGGDFQEILLAVITYNTQAYGGLAEPWEMLFARSYFQLGILCFAIVGIIAALRWHKQDVAFWAVITGVITGAISVIVMRKFFVYHFHVFFSFLLVFAVVGIHTLTARLSKPLLRGAIVASVVAILLYAFYPRHLLAIAIRSEGDFKHKVRSVQSAFSMDSSFGRAVDLRLSLYLGSERNVELVSVTPAIHWMNELDRPSRFTMIHPLTITGPSGKLTSFQHRWRAEYLAALEKRKPKIIALADGPAFLMKYIRRTPKDLALEIEGENSVDKGQLGFAQLLEQHYVLDTTIGGYYIYTRNAP